MPSYNTNVLPTSTGLNLGASNQQWNAFLNLLNNGTPVSQSVQTITFSATPSFSTSAPISVFALTLIGNVTSSTFSGVPGLVIFQITQDATGGRTFAWPLHFNQPIVPGINANAVTTQLFYFDGATAWPLTPGVVYP